MRRVLLVIFICATAAYTIPALARSGWMTSTNVILSSEIMPSGDVMMKVSMPKKDWLGLGRDMAASNGICKIQDVTPGDMTTMLLVCSRP